MAAILDVGRLKRRWAHLEAQEGPTYGAGQFGGCIMSKRRTSLAVLANTSLVQLFSTFKLDLLCFSFCDLTNVTGALLLQPVEPNLAEWLLKLFSVQWQSQKWMFRLFLYSTPTFVLDMTCSQQTRNCTWNNKKLKFVFEIFSLSLHSRYSQKNNAKRILLIAALVSQI